MDPKSLTPPLLAPYPHQEVGLCPFLLNLALVTVVWMVHERDIQVSRPSLWEIVASPSCFLGRSLWNLATVL